MGDIHAVPVPSVQGLKSSMVATELRYEIWLQCPYLATHVIYWGDLQFTKVDIGEDNEGKKLLVCTNDQNGDLVENNSLYCAMKVAGYEYCPTWRGNVLVLVVDADDNVYSMPPDNALQINELVCR
ncbi:hypothetical protein VKT23_019171 [Stygiomarasmius scandens]|uniref:Uncharacterized protein n=1 Tax=Marasmiellus scandens TaxID=2682957 RepID=A0ABR1IP73_9AGAR